jgi:hypothetical protein
MKAHRRGHVPREWPWSRRKRFARTRDALTVIVPVQGEKKEDEEALKKLLGEVGDDVQHNPHLRFDGLGMPHFLSWSFLPGERDERGAEGPPRLVFEANFHGLTEQFLEEFYLKLGETLKEQIYRRCGSRTWSDQEGFKDFFLDSARKTELLFESYRGLSASKIDNDDKVHWFFHKLLARDRTLGAEQGTPEEGSEDDRIERLVQASHRRAQEAIQAPGGEGRHLLDFSADQESRFERLKKRRAVRIALFVPILPVVGMVLGLLAYEVLRTALSDRKERRMSGAPRPEPEADAKAKAREEQLARIQHREDYQAQNHLTLYVELKTGLLRHLYLRLTLFMWNYLAKNWFTEGSLAGIEGIHFARWVILDNGWQWWPAPTKQGRPRRLSILRKRHSLLFLSNYDGSWEPYLDSFIDRASLGLTSIWCNTEGFPKTRLRWNTSGKFPYVTLVMGAQREEEFKQWARQHQLLTTLWYSRHPDKSVSNIRRSREIRSLCGVELDPRERMIWLQRL